MINLTMESGNGDVALPGGIRESFTEEVPLELRLGEAEEFYQLHKSVRSGLIEIF